MLQSARRLSTNLHQSLEDKHTVHDPSYFLRTCGTVRELHVVPCRAHLELSALGTNADTQVPTLTTHAIKRALRHAERVTIRVAEPPREAAFGA